MSPTCKLKTLHEYKALISFKFANKCSIIRKTSWKFPIHYVNTTFDFFGNSFTEQGKNHYWITIFLYRVIKIKFYWFTAAFLFSEDKKSKKLAVTLKFLYFLISLSLKLVSAICYQIFIFAPKWYPFKNYEKSFSFHLKSFFPSWDIQILSLSFHTFQIQKGKWKWNNLWCHELTCINLQM